MQNKRYKLAAHIGIAFIIICFAVLCKGWIDGEFNSIDTMRRYIAEFGPAGPCILTIIQAFQVVVPILPGFLGCIVGGLAFGTIGGFICNYIGICTGSIIAYILARVYGVSLVESIFSIEKYNRLIERFGNGKSYAVTLFLAILLPLAPDDFLCYFSGLIKMPPKKFFLIIIIGKPWCILAYCLLSGGDLL